MRAELANYHRFAQVSEQIIGGQRGRSRDAHRTGHIPGRHNGGTKRELCDQIAAEFTTKVEGGWLRSRSVRWILGAIGRSGVGDPHCDPAGLLAAGAAGHDTGRPGPAHRLRSRALRVVRRLPARPRYRAGPGRFAPHACYHCHLRAWDGAPWIWNLATAILRPPPIVDLYRSPASTTSPASSHPPSA